MRRREFVGLVGGAAVAWPLAARAQPSGRVAYVAFWMGGSNPNEPEGQQLAAAFRDALRGLGWVEGRNVRIEVRWAALSRSTRT